MRIKNNTYYVRCWKIRGKEYTSLSHYKDVWNNGYTVDDYSFDNKSYHFEDAGHHGINPDDKFAGTKISKRYYDRWVKKVDDCKLEIESMANKYSKPYGNKWSVGDYLYFPMKEIFAEEDAKEKEEYPDEYIEEENKYNGPDLCLILVTKTDSEKPEGLEIRVDEYRTDYDDEPRPIDYYLNYIDKARIIPKEIYDKAKELIYKEATEIMCEIKKKVSKIEIRLRVSQ
jgi:hypothetical protein